MVALPIVLKWRPTHGNRPNPSFPKTLFTAFPPLATKLPILVNALVVVLAFPYVPFDAIILVNAQLPGFEFVACSISLEFSSLSLSVRAIPIPNN